MTLPGWTAAAQPFTRNLKVDVFVNQVGFVFEAYAKIASSGIGLGGTPDDQPGLYDGSYHTAEYWTPMVAFTMWLLTLLQKG